MRANCVIVAFKAIRRAHRRGRSPKGGEVHLWIRVTRFNWWGLIHMGWQKNDPVTGQVLWRRSFKPVDNVDLPWYRPWELFSFEGKVVRDDFWHREEPIQ